MLKLSVKLLEGMSSEVFPVSELHSDGGGSRGNERDEGSVECEAVAEKKQNRLRLIVLKKRLPKKKQKEA